jgi:cell division protease FtsH
MSCAQDTAAEADTEIRQILNGCYEEAKALLAQHRELLDEIALYLLQKETITGDELMAYVNASARTETEEGEA